ncbi:hypothetical protein IEQ34_019707 [Dendrobium chrysotoxum]|uniref:Uncharacterized protein n=1 Tax=Dendrobium chrysotoxum TaxID=161865 RepID=A0AAV7G982_DENCH|nr:hypothetical protein IEQ34_019707 [Dendrobium chrysotoxum]
MPVSRTAMTIEEAKEDWGQRPEEGESWRKEGLQIEIENPSTFRSRAKIWLQLTVGQNSNISRQSGRTPASVG